MLEIYAKKKIIKMMLFSNTELLEIFLYIMWQVDFINVKFTLEQSIRAKRGSRCIALVFLQARH
jgi:hypothetical protein